MTDPTLQTMMEVVHQGGLAVARHEELRAPLLFCRTPNDEYLSMPLISTEVHPAEMAQVILYATEATHAALCMEAWEYEAPMAPEITATLRAGHLPQGALRPSQHPDRYDVLCVVGEVRGEPQVHWSWRIGAAPEGGERTFTRRQDRYGGPDGDLAPSRFNPLFLPYAEVRVLIRRHAELARLRDQRRDARN